ncbi:MAG TPA: permease-like cell division protein FtsX [Acidimicrobiia bacterium]|nr:permease-like cell division protein FtsX [Acidimicrobiia bacterium]
MTRFRYFARETLISLRRNLLMTLAGILTVTVSLMLFGGILLFQKWVDHGTRRWKEGVEFEIFLTVNPTEQQVEEVRQELESDERVKNFFFLTKEDAYEEFKRLFSDKPDLVAETSPEALPPSFRVAPKQVEETRDLVAKYDTLPGVDQTVTADEAIRDLIDVTSFLRWAFIGLALVLLASALFLIVNTIRLATFARRREIEVMKLVGASNWFVRVPFMLEGLVQGAVGAGLAVGGMFVLQRLFGTIENREGFFEGFYVTTSNAGSIGIIVLVLGALIGVVGSSIGLRRFLRV